MNPAKKLFRHYETYHAHERPLLKYMGMVASAGLCWFSTCSGLPSRILAL